jgi:hypothetical protein
VQPDANLPQVVGALRSTSGFAGGLHPGRKQGQKQPQNANHDEQLDKRKARWPTWHGEISRLEARTR